MKRCYALLGSMLIFLTFQPSRADVKLIINQKITSKVNNSHDKTQKTITKISWVMTVYISAVKSRYDAEVVTTIIDKDADNILTIDPSSRTYFSDKYSDLLKFQASGPQDAVKVTDTGDHVRLLGHNCHHYIVKIIPPKHPSSHYDTFTTYDMFVTDDFSNDSIDWLSEQFGIQKIPNVKGLPLRLIRNNTYGSLTEEVTSIDTKKISDDIFSVPKGYKCEGAILNAK
jgi:hypothetical protein